MTVKTTDVQQILSSNKSLQKPFIKLKCLCDTYVKLNFLLLQDNKYSELKGDLPQTLGGVSTCLHLYEQQH